MQTGTRACRVSVVIPLYNKRPHIARALESVLAQSFRDFEIVVVDDGSTDGGAEIVRSMGDGRIRLVQQANEGVSAARNRGIKEARADLIAFLDADDSYHPRFLAVILDLAAKHGSAGAYGTSFEIVKENGEKKVWRNASLRGAAAEDVLIRDYFRDALAGPVIWSSATAVPKRTFEEVGLFPVGARLGEDLDMWMRIGAKFPIAVSGFVGAVYHQGAVNRTDNGTINGVEYELVRTGLRLLAEARLDAGQRRHLAEYIAAHQIATASQLILLGQRERARGMLLECRTTRFLHRKLWWLFWTLVPTRVALEAQRMRRRLAGGAR